MALAEVLCYFDKSEVEVEKIEKLTIFRPEGESWYVYKIHVTIHSEGGDVQDVLGTTFDPSEENREIIKYDSANETDSDAPTFVIWRKMQKRPTKGEFSEIPDEELSNIVSQAWTYIEENNVHPEEED